MCVIEKKTYVRSGGRREAYEKTHYCGRNGPNRLCSRTEYRDGGEVRIEEVRPSSSSGNADRSEGDFFVTQGNNGKEKVYRVLTRRNSQKRRSDPTAESSPRSSSDLRSSPTFQRLRPEAPSPPPAAPDPPKRTTLERPPSLMDDFRTRVETLDGTAIYSRPPPLNMPRADENERPRRKLSFKDPPVSGESSKRRPSNIIIDTNFRARGSPPQDTPSSSNIPSPGARRPKRASVTFSPQQDIISNDRPRSQDNSNLVRESSESVYRGKGKVRQRPEDGNDNSPFQDSVAESAAAAVRRRLARETRLPRVEPSKGEREKQEDKRDLERRLTLEAEAQQAKREQANAEDRRNRRRQMQIAAAEEQSRREADTQGRARIQYQIVTPTSPQPSELYRPRQGPADGYPSSPISARSPTAPSKPPIHYYPSARRGSTLRERGEEVLAREQAREARRQVTEPVGPTTLNDPANPDDDCDDGFDYERNAVIEEYVYSTASEALSRRSSRRARKGKEREERRKEFRK